MQEKTSDSKKSRRTRKYVIIGLVVVALVLVDLFTLLGGNIRYAGAWIECRGRPYQQQEHFAGMVPHYISSRDDMIARQRVKQYYCTPLEAEMDGLSADDRRYSYPHLEEQGLPWPDLPVFRVRSE